MKLLFVGLGLVFGFTLSRSGAADYNYIQGMFLFEELQLYGILATAVAVVMPGLWLLKRYGKSAGGAPLVVKPKPLHLGNVAGGLLFGIGWSVSGTCPGPVLVNIGEGKLYALATLSGVLLGTYLLGRLYPLLQPKLRLPPVELGPGAG